MLLGTELQPGIYHFSILTKSNNQLVYTGKLKL